MKIYSAADVAAAAPYAELVNALRDAFRQDVETPVRHQHDTVPGTTLLLMPAWSNAWTGLKLVTFKPDNPAQGFPTIQAQYLLIDNATGSAVAMMDGTELTRRRTAAASALAADYLARPDAAVHAIVGAGALATYFAKAHAAVRPIGKTFICNRTKDKAVAVAKALREDGINAEACSIEDALPQADIITGITSGNSQLIQGRLLKDGAHVDLAGAFKPSMRETDAEAVSRASVYVDTHEGALAEAGDLLQAEAEGRFKLADIKGDLADLCRGKLRGRQNGREITLFKSCGTALEDLAAATLVHLRQTA